MHKIMSVKNHASFTYILWLIGFVIGLASALMAPLHTDGIFLPPTIAGLMLSSWLPVALCLLLCRRKNKALLYILICLNGFVYGFSFLYLSLIYQGIGPVLRIVYFASRSSASLCVLYASATHKCISSHRFNRLSVLCMCGMGVVCIIHYFIL